MYVTTFPVRVLISIYFLTSLSIAFFEDNQLSLRQHPPHHPFFRLPARRRHHGAPGRPHPAQGRPQLRRLPHGLARPRRHGGWALGTGQGRWLM